MADISKITLPNNSEYNLKDQSGTKSAHLHELADLVPIQSKTFTDVIGTANNWANATFFFGSIKPNNWHDLWQIKYKIRTYVPGKNQYDQTAEVFIAGSEDTLRSYASMNTVNAYYPAYYHELYRLKQAGFTNNYGHSLGVRFYSAYSPTDVNYKRTIIVDVYYTENCTFTFYDSCLKYAEIPGTGSTNYVNYSEMNYCTNGLQEAGDANDVNYYNRTYYTSRQTYLNLYRYQLTLTKSDGKLVPVNTVNNSIARNKTLTTEPFDPFGEIFFYASTSTYSAGANVGNGNLYRQYLCDFRYSFNIGGSDSTGELVARNPLYLVAQLQEDGMAVINAAAPLAQALPTFEDGLIYIYLGRVYEDTYPYRCVLTFNHPIYFYKDGMIKTYHGTMSSDLNGIEYIVGTQASITHDWTGETKEKTLEAGKTIAYKLPYASDGTASLNLTLADGTTTGSKPVFFNNGLRVSSEIQVGGVIIMTYNGSSWYTTTYKDTKNTAGSTNSNSKLFLIGASSQAISTQTYSHDTAYIGTDGCLYSDEQKVVTVAGGTINGPLHVDNSFSANSTEIGNLVVTGDASFTNGLRGDLTGTVNGNTPIQGGSNTASTVTITPTTASVYSMTSAGSVTAGTATVPAQIDTTKFSGGSLVMAMDTTDTKKLNITFTAGSLASGFYTAGTQGTPTAVALPTRSASAINVWTGYSTATAAAQTFTGTPC